MLRLACVGIGDRANWFTYYIMNNMKRYFEKHHRFIGFAGSLAALIIAVIYLKVIPEEVSAASGLQEIILRYGHSLCWLLLAGASFWWAIKKKNKGIGILAYAALATYIIFIVTLLITKSM